MSTLEERLRKGLKRSALPRGRRPKITITRSMLAIWQRVRELELKCRCDRGVCPACIESQALEEALRDKFRLEAWQQVAAPDDGNGGVEDIAAHRRYCALELALREARRAIARASISGDQSANR
jgi:hypothetical protein